MIVKLTELYSTKYFYVSYLSDLKYLLHCVDKIKEDPMVDLHAPTPAFRALLLGLKRGEQFILDTASARFTKDTSFMLTLFQRSGIILIDSELPWRQAVYKENRKRLEQLVQESVPLPELMYTIGIREYITSLRTDVLYRPNTSSIDLQIALVTLVTATRPSIQLSGKFFDAGLFSYVLKHINMTSLENYKKFVAKTDEGLRVLDFTVSDTVFLQGHGYIDFAAAVMQVPMIPAAFGEDVILHDPVFESLIQNSLQVIQNFQQVKPKTLTELLSSQQEVS